MRERIHDYKRLLLIVAALLLKDETYKHRKGGEETELNEREGG